MFFDSKSTSHAISLNWAQFHFPFHRNRRVWKQPEKKGSLKLQMRPVLKLRVWNDKAQKNRAAWQRKKESTWAFKHVWGEKKTLPPFLDASKLSKTLILWMSYVRVVLGRSVRFLLMVFSANLKASSSGPDGPLSIDSKIPPADRQTDRDRPASSSCFSLKHTSVRERKQHLDTKTSN